MCSVEITSAVISNIEFIIIDMPARGHRIKKKNRFGVQLAGKSH